MNEYHKHREDCPFTFAPLDVCDCVQKNMAARIEALERQVKAADALAEALSFYSTATVEYPNGAVTFQPGDDNGKRARDALAAYQATKEQSK